MANPRRMGFRDSRSSNVPGARNSAVTGPTPPEISGFSVGTVSTRSGQATTSTTYGSIARANGHGWADRTWSTNRDHMGPWARPPQAAFPGRDRTSLVGPILWATPGSLAATLDSTGQSGNLNDCGSIVRRMDMDGRIERGQPTRIIWDLGRGCARQRSRGAKQRYHLDRCVRNLWLFGERLRLDRGVELSQRPVEVRA